MKMRAANQIMLMMMMVHHKNNTEELANENSLKI